MSETATHARRSVHARDKAPPLAVMSTGGAGYSEGDADTDVAHWTPEWQWAYSRVEESALQGKVSQAATCVPCPSVRACVLGTAHAVDARAWEEIVQRMRLYWLQMPSMARGTALTVAVSYWWNM